MAPQQRSGYVAPRSGRIKWLLLLLILTSLFVFRKSLLVFGVKIALSSLIGTAPGAQWGYDQIAWQQDKLHMSGFYWKSDPARVHIDAAWVQLGINWAKGQILATVVLEHPEVHLNQSCGSGGMFPLLFSHPRFKVNWEMEHGVLQFPSSLPVSRLFFSFHSGSSSLGSFTLCYEPQADAKPLLTADLWAQDKIVECQFHLVESDCGRLVPLLPFLSSASSLQWKDAHGQIAIDGHAKFDEQVALTDFQCKLTAEDLSLTNQMGLTHLDLEHLQAEVSCHPTEGQRVFWKDCSAAIQLQRGKWQGSHICLEQIDLSCNLQPSSDPEFQIGGFFVRKEQREPFQITGNLCIENQELQTSTLHAQIGSIQGSLVIHGDQSERFLDTRWEGKAGAFYALACPSIIAPSAAACLEGTLVKNANGWNWIGEWTIGQEVVHWGLDMQGPTTIAEMLKPGSSWSLEEGWIRSEKCTQISYGPFLSAFLGSAHLIGQFDLFGTYRDAQCNISLQGEDLHLEHPAFALTIPQLGEKDPHLLRTEGRALLTYDWNAERLVCDVPVREGTLVHKELNLTVAHLASDLQISADLSSGQASAKAQVFDLHIPISDHSYLSDGCCELHYDIASGQLQIEKGGGKWELASGNSYQIQLTNLELNSSQAAQFDVKILEAQEEISRLNGQLEPNLSAGWDLQFDQKLTHFYGTQLQMGKVVFSRDGKLLFFEMNPIVNMQNLQKQLKFLLTSGLFATADSIPQDLDKWQLVGELRAQLKWEDSIFNFQAQGRDVQFKGEKIKQFGLIGKKENGRWIIDRMQADDLSNKAIVDVQGKKVILSQIEGAWKQFFWKANAVYDSDREQVALNIDSLQGDLSALGAAGDVILNVQADWNLDSLAIEGQMAGAVDLKSSANILLKQDTPVRFSYLWDQGLQIQNLAPNIFVKGSMQHLGSVCADLLIQKEQIDLSALQFRISPTLVQRAIDAKWVSPKWQQLYYESYLEGGGDVHATPQHLLFKGTLRDGRYGIKDQIFSLQQIGIHYENTQLQCDFKTALNEQPLWGHLEVDCAGLPRGTLQIRDQSKPQGIKATFFSTSSGLCWEKIDGSACGLDIHLTKAITSQLPHASVLTGSVKVDGSGLDVFFPKKMKEKFKNLKLGKGYEFQGDLVLWQDPKKGFELSGQLLGHHFELLGYQFDRLRAGIEAGPQSIHISKLDIDDAAGLFQMKKIEISQSSADQKWSFYIPLLQVKDLQPSRMKKIEKRSGAIKPLVIRNLSLSEVRGDLNDASGWVGKGHLNFTNAFKKESTFFETPIEMIKKFGLDPGLLTPIQGEIQVELCGDKFFLVNMRNAFSEGKRSQFFLAPTNQTSYIDLNGNIHIDIKMRQDVVLKLTEAFTLTIRGNLDKPRYGLR